MTQTGEGTTSGMVMIAGIAGAAGGMLVVAVLMMLSRRFAIRESSLLG